MVTPVKKSMQLAERGITYSKVEWEQKGRPFKRYSTYRKNVLLQQRKVSIRRQRRISKGPEFMTPREKREVGVPIPSEEPMTMQEAAQRMPDVRVGRKVPEAELVALREELGKAPPKFKEVYHPVPTRIPAVKKALEAGEPVPKMWEPTRQVEISKAVERQDFVTRATMLGPTYKPLYPEEFKEYQAELEARSIQEYIKRGKAKVVRYQRPGEEFLSGVKEKTEEIIGKVKVGVGRVKEKIPSMSPEVAATMGLAGMKVSKLFVERAAPTIELVGKRYKEFGVEAIGVAKKIPPKLKEITYKYLPEYPTYKEFRKEGLLGKGFEFLQEKARKLPRVKIEKKLHPRYEALGLKPGKEVTISPKGIIKGAKMLTYRIPKGGYEFVREKPFEVIAYGAAAFVLPAALAPLGKYAIPAAITTIAKIGLPTVYAGAVGLQMAGKPPEIKAEILGKEISRLGVIGIGGMAGSKAWPWLYGWSKFITTKGATWVPGEKLTTPRVLAGKEQFPMAAPKTHYKLFKRKAGFKFPGEKPQDVWTWHTTGRAWAEVSYTKVGIRYAKGEFPGMYVSPSGMLSPHFLRVGSQGFRFYGGEVIPKGITPAALRIKPTGLFKMPKKWLGARELIITKGKAGAAYVPGVGREVQAIVPPHSELIAKPTKFFFKWPQKWYGTPIQIYKTIATGKGMAGIVTPQTYSALTKQYSYGESYLYRPYQAAIAAYRYRPAREAVLPTYRVPRRERRMAYEIYRPAPRRADRYSPYEVYTRTRYARYTPYAPVTAPPYRPRRGARIDVPITSVTTAELPNIYIPGISRKKMKKLKVTRKLRYQPSLVAMLKDIRGKRPARITGLEIRPRAT